MTDLLFATPWWLPATIVVAGMVVFISGNKRQLTGTRNAGLGLILLAVLLVGISYFVETDRERVSRQTRELIDAVEARDWSKMKSLLDPRVGMAAVNGPPIYNNREAVLQGAQGAAERYGLKSVTVTSLEAQQDAADITVSVSVFSVQEATMGRPLPSSWQFAWGQTGEQWALLRITCLKIGDQNVRQIRGLFPN